MTKSPAHQTDDVTDAMQEPVAAETGGKKFDLGIVFVHGIGEQKRGEALVQIVDAFVRCISLLSSRTDVTIPAVELTGVRIPETSNAEACFRFAGSSAGRQRWLVSEAWWAGRFPSPTYGDVSTWAIEILPRTLLVHLIKTLARRMAQKPPLYQYIWPLSLATRVVLGLLLIPILATCLVIILILAAAPSDLIRSVADRLRRAVSSILGDSYVLVSSPARRSAIYTAVRDEILRLVEQCHHVCVIGHSQGAAIAHQVLAAGAPERVRLLITVGSGLEKLRALLDLREVSEALPQEVWNAYWSAAGDDLNDKAAYRAKTAAIARVTSTLRSSVAGLAWPAGATLLLGGVLAYGASGLAGPVILLGELAAACLLAAVIGRGTNVRGMAALIARLFHIAVCVVLIPAWLIAAFWFLPTLVLAEFDIAVGALGTAFGAAFIWLALRSQRFMERDVLGPRAVGARLGLREGLMWFDYFASKDPIPNGTLSVGRERTEWWIPGAPVGWISCHRLHNRNSILGDHTTYWKNVDEFVAQVVINSFHVSGLLGSGALLKLRDLLQESVGHARWCRVRARQVACTLLAAAVAAASGVYWMFAQNGLPTWLESVSVWAGNVPGAAMLQGAGHGWYTQLAIVAIGLIANAAVAAVWNLWDGDAMDKQLRGLTDHNRFETVFKFWCTTIAILAGLALVGAVSLAR